MFPRDDEFYALLKEIDTLLPKVAKVHGKEHPELVQLNEEYPMFKENFDDDTFLIFAKITYDSFKKMTNNFALPDDACEAYTKLYNDFKALEEFFEIIHKYGL